MPEVIHAEIPLSFFEYRATYREPLFNIQKLYSDVVPSVFNALRPWDVPLESVSYKQSPANLGEIAVVFALPSGRIGLSVGLGSTTLVVKNPTWSEKDVMLSIVRAGLKGVLEGGELSLEQQRASIAMHLKPASGTIKEFVTSLVRPEAREMLGDDIKAYGVSAYRQDSVWVVDKSVSFADALFLRIEHVADSRASLEEIAAKLNTDEARILELLGLAVD